MCARVSPSRVPCAATVLLYMFVPMLYMFVPLPSMFVPPVPPVPPVNLAILEDLLKAEGYQTLTAASGNEALEVYLTADPQPKLVLLDVTLPDMSGHEVRAARGSRV